jgi:hypothetical protein
LLHNLNLNLTEILEYLLAPLYPIGGLPVPLHNDVLLGNTRNTYLQSAQYNSDVPWHMGQPDGRFMMQDTSRQLRLVLCGIFVRTQLTHSLGGILSLLAMGFMSLSRAYQITVSPMNYDSIRTARATEFWLNYQLWYHRSIVNLPHSFESDSKVRKAQTQGNFHARLKANSSHLSLIAGVPLL